MCAGIRDAANLTWKLALVLTGRADDQLLATYEAERRPYTRRVIRMAIAVGWLMTGGSARTCRLRRAALRTATRLPAIEEKVFTAVWPAFPPGPLSARGDGAAGRLCPQPRIRTGDGEALLDRALGDGFAIISRGRDVAAAFDPATRGFFDALGTTVVHLGDPAAGGVADVDGVLTALLDETGADALLLRPDHVIAAGGDRADLRRWRRLLEFAGITNP
jgi:3-(3-hydroxy-phenyl)propionate hydroxylase